MGLGREVNRLSQDRRASGRVIHSIRLLGVLELAWSRVLVMEALEGMTEARGQRRCLSRPPDLSQTAENTPYSTKCRWNSPRRSPPPSHQAIVEVIRAAYLWGSKPVSLGNPSRAGNILAVIVKTQICKAKGRG